MPLHSKDLFSTQAKDYARFRPEYPSKLYDHLFSKVAGFSRAWDCGCGNGQVAKILAQQFEIVEATDISEKQIQHAFQAHNIQYSIQNANCSTFADQYFDLIAVGQALHWFDFDFFFKEVKRVLKPKGVFAAWCYGLNSVNTEVDALTQYFYREVVGHYWDSERKHIENKYNDISFPFETTTHEFYQHSEWSAAEYLGYLSTWSSVQHYIHAKGANPVDKINRQMSSAWGTNKRTVTFPIHLKLLCL